MQSVPNRWVLASAAVVMQMCLGIIYAWAVFRSPLEQAYGWSKTMSIAPYRWSILFFTLAMIVAGFWQDRKGPRLVASVGGILLGAGCLLASFIGADWTGLVFSYGVVAGLGVGFAYVTPIATCVKWFPDKRGLVVGLAVMGFGLGSLIFAPLLEAMLGKDPAQFAVTLPYTFRILSLLFFVVVTGCAQLYQVPPVGWKPEGWSPPVGTGPARAEYGPAAMLRTWQFWMVWLVYFLASSVGLTAIGEAAPLVRELAGGSMIMTAGAALGVMSLFNGLGRLGWGALSDRLGQKAAMLGTAIILTATCALLLPGANTFGRVLAGICLVGICYGGTLAVMPSVTAAFFGPRHIGANYGILFTAWGTAGFVVPRYCASVIEQAKTAGHLAAGYDQVFFTLAGLAALGIVASALVKRPA
jgi:MFS transporter, OFA family, oxalate/formate antiporter